MLMRPHGRQACERRDRVCSATLKLMFLFIIYPVMSYKADFDLPARFFEENLFLASRLDSR